LVVQVRFLFWAHFKPKAIVIQITAFGFFYAL